MTTTDNSSPNNQTVALEKKFNPQVVEPRLYDVWEKSGFFASDSASAKQPYTIMMPPPNVTGTLHMGHALTYTLQDVLIRYNRLRGKDALWQPGMDHAGIATQGVVERQLAAEGKTRHDLGRETFLERIWQWKAESGGTILKQMRHLGASADWARERFTMDEGLSTAVRKVFVQLYKEKLIYRDKRLVNWDVKLHTAISDLEVDSREMQGSLWHFRYPYADGSDKYVIVATTRPETMLGDSGVAVHPEDERYQDLVGKSVRLPILDRDIPVVADEYADPETGTGAVKMTPAHDFNDFEVGRRQNLQFNNIFDSNACLQAATNSYQLQDGKFLDVDGYDLPAEWVGLDRFELRKAIVEKMEALGLLEKIEPHTNMVPHGDRSGTVVEPWLTDQWFCDAETLAKPALEAVETGKTKFVPKQWENTYYEWMRNIQPWCISRQIWWGHQIPAWFGPDETIFVEETEADALAAAQAHYGKTVELRRETDVLDTWFSSALWPFTTLGWPEKTPELSRYYPGDVLTTGFDIIFFWVARMMMMGIHFMGDVPFHTVYVHALVRDEHGQKMSKSKGNVIDPTVMAEQYGVDPLRFTLTAMAAPGRDIKLADSRVEGYRNFVTKIWNAASFCQMNDCQLTDNFDPATVSHQLSKWIIAEVCKTTSEMEKAFETYRFNDAANAIYQFLWGTFCAWYIEFSKPLLQGEDEQLKQETRQVMAWVIQKSLILLHPIMPYVTEELWRSFGTETVLIGESWPELSADLRDEDAITELQWLIRLISGIRAVRAEMNIPPKAKISYKVQQASADNQARLTRHQSVLLRLAAGAEINIDAVDVPAGSVQVVHDEMIVFLPLADVIDLDKEKERLQKEIAKAESEIAKIDKKLSNESFVSRAPEAVVAEQHTRRENYEQQVTQTRQALTRLEQI